MFKTFHLNLERINAFPYVKINNKKLKEYEGKLQEMLYNFLARFIDLQKLKSFFSFLENTFEIDVVTNGCPISEPLVSEVPAVEMELLGDAERSCFKNGPYVPDYN